MARISPIRVPVSAVAAEEFVEVVKAAVEWRRRVSIAGPPNHRPPEASTRLAEAVDRFLDAIGHAPDTEDTA